ncbi:hypothetical protein HDU81_005190 [Chytriomyces hyalinus]|nr:hypothetical protein HDU81_005190 [Chytriomyces hyalinus]
MSTNVSTLSAQISSHRQQHQRDKDPSLHRRPPIPVQSSPVRSQSQSLPRNNSASLIRRLVNAKRRGSVVSQTASSPVSIPNATSDASVCSLSPAMSFLSMLGTPKVGSLDVSLDFAHGVYEEGDQIANYTLTKEIGCGSFSRVFLAHDSISNKNYAIKILRKPNTCSPIHSPTYSLENSMDTLSMKGRISIPNYHARDAGKGRAVSSPQSSFQTLPGPTSIYAKDRNDAADNARQLMDKETRIWASLDHPNILCMHEVLELDDAVCIVSEHAAGGSLLDYLTSRGCASERVARHMFLQLAQAVSYMHKTAGVIHRDLKCENVLVLEDWEQKNAEAGNNNKEWIPTLKIADFGLSEFIRDDSTDDCASPTSPTAPPLERRLSTSSCAVGSLHYCAPEDLQEAASDGAMNGASSDVWALGCILYAMLTGALPFNDGFLPRLQQTIMNGTYDASRLESCDVSDGAQQLLKGIFCVDVPQRFTIEDVLASEWLQGCGEVEG